MNGAAIRGGAGAWVATPEIAVPEVDVPDVGVVVTVLSVSCVLAASAVSLASSAEDAVPASRVSSRDRVASRLFAGRAAASLVDDVLSLFDVLRSVALLLSDELVVRVVEATDSRALLVVSVAGLSVVSAIAAAVVVFRALLEPESFLLDARVLDVSADAVFPPELCVRARLAV